MNESKKIIMQKLVELAIPFVDVGMGINVENGLLTGSVRISVITPEKSDHMARRISFGENANDDYDKNIQIAEVNALNAALAVIRWKKLFGIYHDLGKEHHAVYEINTNKVINDEAIP